MKKVVATLACLAVFSAFAIAGDQVLTFATGQAASMLVGQVDFSSTFPGAEAYQLGSVAGLAVAGNRLIISDGGFPFNIPTNNRVLIFNNLSALSPYSQADVVVGQAAFGFRCGSDSKQSCISSGAGAKGMNRPLGVSTDGIRLAVADSANNRILIFNRIPDSNGASADVVVGQADFTGIAAGTSQSSLRQPNGVFLAGGRLFVADTLNHRVLIFNSIPASSNAKADVVLGQKDFTSRIQASAGPTAMFDPVAVTTDGVRLIVTDLGFNRVLIFNSIPTTNGAAADVVVGQADFTTNATNAVVSPVYYGGSPAAGNTATITITKSDGARFSYTYTVAAGDGLGQVANAMAAGINGHTSNDTHGVTATSDGANSVSFKSKEQGTPGTSLKYLAAVTGALLVAPTTTQNFSAPTDNAAGSGAGSLNFPRFAYSDVARLYIADSGNNRVLVFNKIPTYSGAQADVVLGQSQLDAVSEGTAAERLALPAAIAPSAKGILVADSNNRRIVEFTPGLPLVRPGAVVNAASFNGNGLARPANVTAQADTGGSLPAGRYYLKVTAQNAFPRESTPSEEISVDVPASGKVTVNWDPISGVTSYRVYVGTLPGFESISYATGVTNATAPPVVFDGTPAEGNTVTITITKSDNTTFNATYTVLPGDGLAQVAKAVAAAVNGNTSNDSHGVTATSDGISNVTFKSKELGTLGSSVKYLAAVTGSLTVTPNTTQTFAAPTEATPQPTLTFDNLYAAPNGDIGFSAAGPLNNVVPGSIVSLFGTDLAPALTTADGTPLPTELVGTSVLVNGQLTPLVFVAPNQISFQVPMEATGSSASVQVRKRTKDGETTTVAVPVGLTFPEPAIYSLDGTGSATVLAYHSDGSIVTVDNPATVSEVISIRGTGFGLMADVPGNFQVTVTGTGGNVIPGTYFSRVTTIFADGAESLGSQEIQISSASGNTAKMSFTWDAVDGAAGYRVYIGTRTRGFDRYFETSTNSFDFVNIVGKSGIPPNQTNVPGDGKIHVATTLQASIVGLDMPIFYKSVAPGKVGIFQLNLQVPSDMTPSDLGLQEGQMVGLGDMRLVVGAIESNHVYLPIARPPPPMINLDHMALTFSGSLGGQNPAGQTVNLTKTGGGVLNWTATAATDSGAWLSVSPASGTDSGALMVSVDITGLALGTYTGTITVSDDNASNSPQTVMVTLTVAPPATMHLDRTALTFAATVGGNPNPQTVNFTKTDGGPLNWTATAATGDSGAWLSVSPVSGTDNGALTVSIDITGLAPGAYKGTITITADIATNSPQTVNVTLTLVAQ